MLKTLHINKYFGEDHVLKDINFEMDAGEIVVIVGPSGSGKSTFLRTMNVLERPTSGDILFMDESILYKKINEKKVHKKGKELTPTRTEIGMVFQSFNLFPHKTVLQNVVEGPLFVRKYEKEQATKEGESLLEKVGLLEKKNQYPDALSGGQQQRVAIARALAMNPKLMLFDEPTSALDPELIGEVLNVIKKLAKEGMTMVIVTHEMNFARNLADRIIFMDQGKIVRNASPKEFFNSTENKRINQFLANIDRG
ncbi:amino acid ABC transporter ATP-binding protein [Lentibacillus salicampi]|uniref:Amino acid ABC transporter ATP-binding protein n=1 Tax=Lentibacillus salicampi TaxID=175306 RepID=A0A4Y9AB13_9BACI|nr:amino acid ABC transporter ATP-binding protein [Lentibacillus salicampi]TFJ92110.1 amino acid ABC transporter ATP-binding protein [Lentibacillus salicampi]